MEAILKEGLAQLGLDTGSIPALTEFSRRLLEKNQVMNLTAITEPADVARLHLLDCACLLTAADFRGKQVVDVGTGAGFPGMPLRLLEPNFDLTLLDSLGKRIDFLQETVDAMGLQRVQCVHARAEEFARQHREQYDIAASRAVAQLSHPNIVSVYDVSCSDDVDYIVMELIDGVTLKQYMERRGQMDWREALHFITQIMWGLSHAHSRGVIHRDIKPQNIMVLRDGSVRVADFGIACLADQGQTLTQETLGSVHYISPEQARGDRVDARSDIYSAGVVLYEMLTGKLPFQGDSAVSVAIQHLSAVPKTPRELNPDIPEALELICMKAMCPDISKRYQTADAMLDDLEKFRKDPAVDMDYIREDLKAAVVCQEPTQPLPTNQVAAVSRANSAVAQEEEDKKHSRKVVGLVIGGFALALVLIFVVFKLVAGGFDAGNGTASHQVPNLLGKTLEEAEALPEVKDVFRI